VLLTVAVVLLVLNLSIGDKQVDTRVQPLYGVADPQFRRAMGSILGPALIPGNRVQALVNGAEAFPAMLHAIRSARHSIALETYIFWSGRIGHEFADALAERARAGVRVHLLLDWIGGRLDDSLLARMERDGVRVRRYNAPRWNSLDRLNSRTHRKLLIVDGSVGFTGGMGIADQWTGNAQDPEHWRDTQFRLEGPAVAQMQSAFVDNWLQATGEVLHGEDYLPPLEAAGSELAQVFTSSPGGGAESMQLMYLLSIAAARESIRISASYFVPDNVAVNELAAALARGVHVQIILPGEHMDRPVVRRASRAGWGKLLAGGAEIYEYEPTMYHAKVLIVDSRWVSVGSTNFDNRSFAINDEANLNVLDAAFAQPQVAVFDDDLARAQRVTIEEWRSRSLFDEAADFAASLLSSQL
jgi:cardiolipin synthase